MQSTFEAIYRIESERKVNIEDLVFPSEHTSNSNMETIDIKEEPLEKSINETHESLMVHEIINSSSFATTVSDKNELKFVPIKFWQKLGFKGAQRINS